MAHVGGRCYGAGIHELIHEPCHGVVGRKMDSTGAQPPNSADLAGTAPIKEITVTDAMTVNVTRLPFG
jgi:hypothetical protein